MTNWEESKELIEKFQMDFLPESEHGEWNLHWREIDKDEAQRGQLSALFNGHRRYTPEGRFIGLIHYGHVIMSDVPDERTDHFYPILNAHGHCLVHGLGIGFVACCMLEKTTVEKVTVIEIEPDVISLVAPHLYKRYGKKRLEIIQGDALTWRSPVGKRYQVVWHDIWSSICSDNYGSMKKLHRRYGHKADWQGSWCRHLTVSM